MLHNNNNNASKELNKKKKKNAKIKSTKILQNLKIVQI